MSGAVATLKFLLVAKNEASSVIKKVGGDAGATGGRLGNMGKVGKAALLGVGAAAVGFGASAINKFKAVTLEARGVQRAMGGTIEEASRWAFAAKQSGVDTGTFTKSMQKFDKTLVTAGGSAKMNAAMVAALGFNYRDAHGNLLPMSELLPKISDKFESMPDGAEKTALAMKLFGKAGTAMLPMLGKGSAGLADLRKETDKYGLTITDKNVKAMADAKVAQRQWSAALDGLKVQIGAFLLPLMTKFTVFIQSYIIPVVQKVTGFFREHTTVLKVVGIAIGAVVTMLGIYKIAMIATSVASKVAAVASGAMTAAQWLLNAAMDANPIGLIVIAIAALAAGFVIAYKKSATFRSIVQGALHGIKRVVEIVWPILKGIFKVWAFQFVVIGKAAMFLWHHVIEPVASGISAAFHGIGRGLSWVKDNVLKPVFGWIKAGIRGVRDVIKPVVHTISTIFKGIGAGLKWAYDNVIAPIANTIMSIITSIIDGWEYITSGGQSQGHLDGTVKSTKNGGLQFGDKPPGHATGGSVRDGMFTSGEHGTELGYKSGNTVRFFSHAASGPMLDRVRREKHGGGDTYNISLGVFGDPKSAAKILLTELQRLKGSGVQVNLA